METHFPFLSPLQPIPCLFCFQVHWPRKRRMCGGSTTYTWVNPPLLDTFYVSSTFGLSIKCWTCDSPLNFCHQTITHLHRTRGDLLALLFILHFRAERFVPPGSRHPSQTSHEEIHGERGSESASPARRSACRYDWYGAILTHVLCAFRLLNLWKRKRKSTLASWSLRIYVRSSCWVMEYLDLSIR